MKMAIFIFLLWSTLAMGSGPKYTYPTPRGLDDEIQNIYHDIANAKLGYTSLTLAQLKTYSPASAGLPFYCSDCTVSTVCISTGTAIFGVSDISGRTTACH